ncbi:MAG: BatD family protein [Candidatus Gracilibacteria bacterium]|nr:BatD family protein [Candidatus Gracilibacteria bacterium]
MKRKIILILFFFFSFFGIVFAGNKLEVNLETDKKEIDLTQNLQIKIIIKQIGENNLDLGDLSLSGIDNFSVVGQSNSTSVEIVNNDAKSISSIIYDLKAKNVGNFIIGPAIIKIGTGTYQTNKIDIKVLSSGNLQNQNIYNETKPDNNKSNLNFILIGIIVFLFLFTLGLFLNFKRFSSDFEIKKTDKIEKFSLVLDVNDDNFEDKIDKFIRKYIERKYKKNISSYTYKDILNLLINNNFQKENLIILDQIFSYLIINKYNREKVGNREEIIKNIKILEE